MSRISCGIEQNKNIHSLFIHSSNIGNVIGIILPTLFTRIIVRPDTNHMDHSSSRYYSLKILFIVALSTKIPTLQFILRILTIHIVNVQESTGVMRLEIGFLR